MKTIKINILIVFCLIISVSVFSQESKLFSSSKQKQTLDINAVFVNYSRINGLSSNEITSITQDKYGFIWIGTKDGLNRFDGVRFVNFIHDKNKNSISNNYVTYLEPDSSGIWIGTLGGLNKFDFESNSFINFTTQNSKLNNDTILALLNEDNKLYISVQNSFVIYEKGKDSFYAYKNKIIYDNTYTFNSIVPIEKNKLIIGWNLKSYIFNKSTKKLKEKKLKKHISVKNKKNGEIWACHPNKRNIYKFNAELQLTDSIVSSTSCKISFYDNFIYYGGYGGSFLKFNKLDSSLTIYKSINKNYHINNGTITYIFTDKQGNVWVGKTSGLSLLLKDQNKITQHFPFWSSDEDLKNKISPSNSYTSLLENKIGILYLGTNKDALVTYNPKTGIFEQLKNKSIFESSTITDITEDVSGNCWMTLWDAKTDRSPVVKFDSGTKKFSEIKLTNSNVNNNSWYSSIASKDNLIFAGSWGTGLGIVNIKEQKFVKTITDKYFNLSSAVFIDSYNSLWIGFTKTIDTYGVTRYNIKTEKLENFNKNNSIFKKIISINSFCQLSDEVLLIGTTEGIISYNYKTNTFYRDKDFNSVSKQNIGKIVKSGSKLWILNSDYVSSFDIKTKKIHTITNYYKINNDLVGLSALKNGKIIVYGEGGFAEIDTTIDIEKSNKIKVSQLNCLGKNYIYLPQNNSITLPAEGRNFNIQFGLISFNNQILSRIRYRLLEQDTAWKYVSNLMQDFPFSVTKPGKYRFEYQAINAENKYEGANYLEINILPLWNESRWYFPGIILLSLIVVFSLLIFGTFYLKTNVRKSQLSIVTNRFSPHFVKNALHLNLNIFDEYPKTILEESIKLFTELYQNYNVITFPLKQEIFFSKRYIQIQKMQLGNLFAAKWTIEPGLENYIVPKLCIQTYVENFFKYGITNANQINKIDILIKKENNYICIEIEDNGLGLSINNSHVLKSKTGLSTINVLYDYVNLFSHNLIEYSFINKQDIDKEKTGIKIILKIPDNIPELSLDKQQINPIIALNYFKLKIKKLWKKYIKLFW